MCLKVAWKSSLRWHTSISLCQRLDSRDQYGEREARDASAEGARLAGGERRAKRVFRRRPEVPRSGTESLRLRYVFVSPVDHVTCQNRIRPFNNSTKFITLVSKVLKQDPALQGIFASA